ncbi:Uncharacterized protein BM_BM6414 [Brugia malayi]|uniref:N-alpha-acetyltransferase 40 n=1 Tax=Brugia malayi TaxID=6279 RepID=A0A4E9FMI7_BRUMA|nr:Uncharacterized protein BM_BM6414 [Brugia malayi]VIO97947.1 Uncharacterized protein BM_BM6414 [Brugia malayi]
MDVKKKLVKKATKLINTENAIGGTTRFENFPSYEIQVESEYQVKGIGSTLLSIAECIGKKMSMDKLMATVFAFNGNSLAFFHKNGFSVDSSCPDSGDYLILSKSLSE